MRYATPWPRGLQLIAALLVPLILISCTSASRNARVLPRQLPPAPEWAAPVAVPRPPAGTDWIEIAQREQSGRLEANARILRFGAWYEERRAEYAAPR